MDDTIFEKMWNKSASEDLAALQSFWDLRAEEFNETVTKQDKQNGKNELMEFLYSKDIFQKGYDVLDIGCGTGKYSLEFAKSANSVVGVDISPQMLKYAEENVQKNNLSNVTFKLLPWQNLNIEDLNWQKKFDLVFVSMSPAINCKASLMKMLEATKKYGFMSGFVHRKDSIKDKLMEDFLGTPPNKGSNNSIYCAFNILWNLGIYPEIVYKDVIWKKQWTVEKASEIYSLQLQKKTPSQDNLQEKVKNYLKKISNDGNLEETIDAKIAWMFWKI